MNFFTPSLWGGFKPRPPKVYDAIVVGLGAHGSSAVYHLAKMGLNVLGMDRFSPPHDFGSHSGETRVTRTAIGEGPEYPQLVLRSRQLWRALEAETMTDLFREIGCLTIGKDTMAHHGVQQFLQNIRDAAAHHNIPNKQYANGAEIRRDYPQFNVRDDEQAVLDQWGGYLFADSCIKAHLMAAKAHGAVLKRNTPMAGFESTPDGVKVTAENGDVYHTKKVILCTGAWMPEFLPKEIGQDLEVTRQVLYWFEVRGDRERFYEENFPTFIWDVGVPEDQRVTGHEPRSEFYGFPVKKGARVMKIAHEETGPGIKPGYVSRRASKEEEDRVYQVYAEPFLPGVGPRCIRSKVCMYTKAPGARAIVDWMPEHENVLFASACSGHFFKHSAALGEALAETVAKGAPTRVDLSPFTMAAMRQWKAKNLEKCVV